VNVANAFIFQAIIHPDTGGKIFMPFRMSGKCNLSLKYVNVI